MKLEINGVVEVCVVHEMYDDNSVMCGVFSTQKKAEKFCDDMLKENEDSVFCLTPCVINQYPEHLRWDNDEIDPDFKSTKVKV